MPQICSNEGERRTRTIKTQSTSVADGERRAAYCKIIRWGYVGAHGGVLGQQNMNAWTQHKNKQLHWQRYHAAASCIAFLGSSSINIFVWLSCFPWRRDTRTLCSLSHSFALFFLSLLLCVMLASAYPSAYTHTHTHACTWKLKRIKTQWWWVG